MLVKTNDREKFAKVNEKLYRGVEARLMKYYRDRSYYVRDRELSEYKKTILKANTASVALAYIATTQHPYMDYLVRLRKHSKYRELVCPERFIENADYVPFEKIVTETGDYSQVKQLFALAGVNAVNAGVAMYKKGKDEGLDDAQIQKDLEDCLRKRYNVEVDFIGHWGYGSYKALEYCQDNVKKQIVNGIMETRAEEFFDKSLTE